MRSNPYFSKQKLFSLGLVFVVMLGVSCSKTNSGGTPSAPAITSFSFMQGVNQIPVNSSAVIQGSVITIFLPPGTVANRLVPSFTLTDSTATLSVNGTPQQSGVTPVDFSSGTVNYTLTDKHGNTQIFYVGLVTDIQPIDSRVAAFMQTYNIPALSIAITQDDRLVYAKTYGMSDVQNNVAANNQSLFRLASLSKQVTSVSIMRLIDQGKIHMQDKVFGPNGILSDFGTAPFNPGVTNITIDELLHHTCGGWSNDDPQGDPVFSNYNLNRDQLVNWTVNNWPLDTIPGTNYDYSNFGFFVLGRVIEKITGLNYDSAAKQLVLQPCGISDMQIGGSTLADRLPNEVIYYPQNGENPYNIDFHRQDANGGWIANATDLAKFLCHVDGTGNDIISPQVLTMMTTGSSANPNYGCGWILTGINYWHNGSLPGTSTEQAITKSSGNFNFVILTNSRNQDPNLGSDMDNIFWKSFPNIPVWPSYDLFGDGGK